MSRRPKHPELTLNRAAFDHMQRARKLGESLDTRLAAKKEAADDWQPDDSFRRDFEMVTQTLKQCGEMMIRSQEAFKKHLENMSDAQLAAQMREEIIRGAAGLTDEEFNLIVSARGRKGRS